MAPGIGWEVALPQKAGPRARNAEGVSDIQPRVARASALPWVIKTKQIPTLKGLRNRFSCERLIFCEHPIEPRPALRAFGNPFRVAISWVRSLPRVAALRASTLGWRW